jgi:hypothetical protein
MKGFTACAVRADRVLGFAKRSVHVDTPSITVQGEARLPEEGEEAAGPLRITDGDRQDKRPALKQCVLSTRCVARAVPRWGTPDDGHAAAPPGPPPVLSAIAAFLAAPGVAAGAYSSVADAAGVPAAHVAALGATRFITRLPTTYTAWGRLIAETGAQHTWEAQGVLAHTTPPTPRPGMSSHVAAGEVPRYGTP